MGSVHIEPQVTEVGGLRQESQILCDPETHVNIHGNHADLARWDMSVLLWFLDHTGIMVIHTAKKAHLSPTPVQFMVDM